MKNNQSKIRAQAQGMTISIHTIMNWYAQPSQDGGWVGICKELGITTEADTLDELHSLAPEAMELLFLDLLEDGELDEFLSQKGWDYSKGAGEAPETGFRVPWQLSAAGKYDLKPVIA